VFIEKNNMPNIKLIHGEYISIHYKVIINALEELNDRYILVYNIFSNMSLASGTVSLYSLKKRQNRKQSLCMHTLHMPVIWENKLIDFKTEKCKFKNKEKYNCFVFDKRMREYKYKHDFIKMIMSFICNKNRGKMLMHSWFLVGGL
jgi:uncharacterized membrane protein YgaE (UPF0421/DUF939 family)